jgi:group I intron endonuclease
VNHIYLIRNKVNGKVYVGQTRRTLEARWEQHVRDSRRSSVTEIHGHAICRAIRKYGPENFSIEFLYYNLPQKFVDEMEIYGVRVFHSNDGRHGYNMTAGGGGCFRPSDEVRAKMRKPHVMSEAGYRSISEKTRKRFADRRAKGLKGYTTKAGREKLSRLMSKRFKGRFGKDSYSFGLKRSKESRRKMSMAACNRGPVSPLFVMKMRVVNKYNWWVRKYNERMAA